MGRHDDLIVANSVLEALPALEFIRTQFCRCVTTWLPSWYRTQALQFATENKEHSAKLGDEGLKAFRSDIEQLATQAEATVDFYLGDEIWWHFDGAVGSDAVPYSVRLCMGRLAIPLQRSGYLKTSAWREFVIAPA